MREFIAYYRALYVGNVRSYKRGVWNLEMFLIVISGLLVAGVTACLNNSYEVAGEEIYSGTMFIYAATFVYVAALSMGASRRVKPSVMNLAPISYKKRAIYSHIAIFTFGLVFIVCWLAITLAFMLLISLTTLIFTGGWILLTVFEKNAGIAHYPDVQGVLFIVLLFIALFGAGMAISYIQNKKARYSMLFVCPAVFGAFALLVANLASAGGKFVLSNNMLFNFTNLPLSWLWLAATAMIALGICAVSVCLAIKYEKPKTF